MKRQLASLFFLAIAGVATWLDGPGLIADYQFQAEGQKPQLASSYRLSERPTCRVYLLVISTCTVSYQPVASAPQTLQPGWLHFWFFGRAGGERVVLVESAKSGIVSTGTQLDRLTNRTIFLAIFDGLSLLLVVGGLVPMPRRSIPRRDEPRRDEPPGDEPTDWVDRSSRAITQYAQEHHVPVGGWEREPQQALPASNGYRPAAKVPGNAMPPTFGRRRPTA
ncbi:MAG: hypothetical protein P4L82_06785 [Ancalomicrobiaceae bacterium]|nr:hypothetical protein [Ancalomicrobiaceae bacterium]